MRSRIVVGFLAWTLLVEAIPLYLCAWFGLTQAARFAASEAIFNVGYFEFAFFEARMMFSNFAMSSFFVTVILGVALGLLSSKVWMQEKRWPWLVVGAIAGAAMGWSWLSLKLSISAVVMDYAFSGVSDIIARILLNFPPYEFRWMVAVGAICGIVCALIFRRIVLGGGQTCGHPS